MSLRTVLVSMGAVALLLSGCGGSDDEPETDGEASAEVTTDEAASEESEPESDDAPIEVSGDYCEFMADPDNQEVFSGVTGSQDMPDFGKILALMSDLGDIAPDEISDDFEVLTATMTDMRDLMDEAGLTQEVLEAAMSGDPSALEDLSPEQMQKMTEMGTKMQQVDFAAVTAAGQEVARYTKDECGIDIENLQ